MLCGMQITWDQLGYKRELRGETQPIRHILTVKKSDHILRGLISQEEREYYSY